MQQCCKIKRKRKSQFHQECECSKCHEKMDKAHLEEHMQNECQFRIVICKFCDLALAFCDLHEHETTCVNQTIYCSSCGLYIAKAFYDEHRLICGQTIYEQQVWNWDCPICLFPQLTESELVQHCESCHDSDSTTLDCPICVSRGKQDGSFTQNFLNHLHEHHTH